METYVYVLLREHSGYNTYEGLFKNFQSAKDNQSKNTVVRHESIDLSQIVDDTIYVAQSWDIAANTHIYNGIYYSYEIAKKHLEFFGGKGMVLQHNISRLK